MNLEKLNVSDLRSILKNHYARLNKTELIKSIQGLNLHNIEAIEQRQTFIDTAKADILKSRISREIENKKIDQLKEPVKKQTSNNP